MSLRQMASETGLNYNVMTNQITNGTVPKKPGVCETIAKALGCTVDYLVSGEENSMVSLTPELQGIVDNYTFLDDKKKRAVKALIQYLVVEQEEDNYQYKKDNDLLD